MDQRSCRKFRQGNVPEQFVQGKVHAQKQGDISTRNPKSQETEKFEKETYSGRISEGSKRSNSICVKVSVPGNI